MTAVRSQRLLITGAGGYLGAALTRALCSHGGFEVVALVRRRAPPMLMPTITADLTERKEVLLALRTFQPHFVLHAAGQVHGAPAELFRENTAATIVLADAILTACPDAILTSLGSAAEYGRPVGGNRLHEDAPLRPVTVYGHAKAAASGYLTAASERGLRSNRVRVFNPVGVENSTGQVVGAFLAKLVAVRGAPPPRVIKMGSLAAIRDFVATSDIATLVIRLFEQQRTGIVVNACSGQGRLVRNVIQHIVATSGADVEIAEREAPPTSGGGPDVVVGDVSRFLEITGLTAPTRLEPILEAAWSCAEQADVAHKRA